MKLRAAFAAALVLAAGGCKIKQQDDHRPATAREFPLPYRPVSPASTKNSSSEATRDDRREAQTVMDLANIKPGMTVADIGAGEGYYTVRLAARVGKRGRVLAEDIALRNGSTPFDLSPEAVAMLAAQPWRGNTRELRNVLEQAAMRGDSPHIEVEALEAVLRETGIGHIAPPLPPGGRKASAEPSPDLLRPLGDQVAELERQAIQAALKATGGNKLAAAKLLGISRAKLYERLEALPEIQTFV